MGRTLQNHQKADWKAHVSTLKHVFNATTYDSRDFSPTTSCLVGIYDLRGIEYVGEIPKSRQDYSGLLKDRLQFAYKKASDEA